MLNLSGLLNPLRRGEKGQMIILVAFSLAVMLFMAALTIDIGFQMLDKRDAQNDADAMALAGAQELDDATTAEATARAWAPKNDVDVSEITSVIVNGASCSATDPDEEYITVRLKRTRNTFLGHLFGADSTEVNVCATAHATYGSGGYAIFANNSDCPGDDTLELNGSNNSITGLVHSNGWLKIPGSNTEFIGDTTYTCNVTVSGSGNTFEPEPPYEQEEQDLPYNYDYSEFNCTWEKPGSNDLKVSEIPSVYWKDGNPSTKELLPGVYCQSDPTKKIDLDMADLVGTGVSFVTTGQITGSASDSNLTPNLTGGLECLFYTSSSSDSAIDISGSDWNWDGIVLAPNGRIKLAGSGSISLTASIIGDYVQASGSNWDLTSWDDGAGEPHIRLIQ